MNYENSSYRERRPTAFADNFHIRVESRSFANSAERSITFVVVVVVFTLI